MRETHNELISVEVEKPIEPILIAHLDAIKIKPAMPELRREDFTSVFDNTEYRKHIFEEAQKAFLFFCDEDRVAASLNAEPNKADHAYLKRVRRLGLIMKGVYNLADSRHKTPPALQKFLKKLGDHNDHYFHSTRKDLTNGVSDNPKFWGQLVEKNFSFSAASTPDFHDHLNKIVSEILDLSNHANLPIREFHTLRKQIRFFADFLQVPASEDFQGRMHWLFASFLELSVKLGKQHDNLIDFTMNTPEVYESLTVELDPSIREQFAHLLSYLKKVTGLES